MNRSWFRWWAALGCLAFAACSDGGFDGIGLASADRRPGDSAFISADGSQRNSGRPPMGGAPEDGEGGRGNGDDGGGERTVEEGDIYRVLSNGKLLNFNSYRGLQIIDVSNPAAPSIVGRLPLSGSPVEAYVSGETAHLLINDWFGYYGGRGSDTAESVYGGLLVSVDISRPEAPREIARHPIDGHIGKSRLARSEGGDILYVAQGGYWSGSGSGSVASFAVSHRGIAPVDRVSLDGYVVDIAATPRAILVARQVAGGGYRSTVSAIDISNPDGTMVLGGEVAVSGWVQSQFNMDLRGNILRVVSTDRFGSGTNHLETFDATDLQTLTPITKVPFGTGEDLYATIFLDDAAFFVTYFRVDPFHAFSIDENGIAVEKSEFIVSGWNDFFRPVSENTRLVGIGMDDQGGRTLAVSLYDITVLENPEPLVARAHVDSQWSWSEANWDHRAFSILEDSVEVRAADGTLETGLVLLPFNGWSETGSRSAVQIFTFSDHTLTRRGVLEHGSQVRRSFQVPGATASLSEEELALFDISSPDDPVELGRIDLAPNHSDVLVFGDFLVRKSGGFDPYGWWYGATSSRPTVIEVVPRRGDPSTTAQVARIELPAEAALRKVGRNLLAAVSVEGDRSGDSSTAVRLFDLSEPSRPRDLGTFSSPDLSPSGNSYQIRGGDCWECGWYGPPWTEDNLRVAGQSLVFAQPRVEEELLGEQRVCERWPDPYEACTGRVGNRTCTFYEGYQECVVGGSGRRSCEGTLETCTWTERTDEISCVETPNIPTEEYCYDHMNYRYRIRMDLQVLDLTTPAAPSLVKVPVGLGQEEDFVSLLVDGSDVWVSSVQPETVRGSDRRWVRFFTRKIDLSRPSRPTAGRAINIPGDLLSVSGSTLLTRDLLWNGNEIESALASLRLDDNRAILEAHRRFPASIVRSVHLDGAGHLLVERYDRGYDLLMTILNPADGLSEVAEVRVEDWGTLMDARAGRALFQVYGGILVYNLDDPTRPWPQAFFRTEGWPSTVRVEGREILIPAGRYGIYRFDLDEINLQPRRG